MVQVPELPDFFLRQGLFRSFAPDFAPGVEGTYLERRPTVC